MLLNHRRWDSVPLARGFGTNTWSQCRCCRLDSAPPESTERTIHAAAAVYTHTRESTSREKSGGMCLEAARWVQTLELNENLERERERKKKRKKYIYLSGRKKKKKRCWLIAKEAVAEQQTVFFRWIFFSGKKGSHNLEIFLWPGWSVVFFNGQHTHTEDVQIWVRP